MGAEGLAVARGRLDGDHLKDMQVICGKTPKTSAASILEVSWIRLRWQALHHLRRPPAMTLRRILPQHLARSCAFNPTLATPPTIHS